MKEKQRRKGLGDPTLSGTKTLPSAFKVARMIKDFFMEWFTNTT